MLLAIDCGNTNTVFSIWDGSEFIATWRTATEWQRTADQYYVWLSTLMTLQKIEAQITDVIVSSTVPRVVFNLRVLSDRYFNTRPYVVGKADCLLPIGVRVDEGTAVGPDRLVNTVAGYDIYGGDLVIVDFGTATTFDVADADGAYVGGVIAPGVNLSLEALHNAAAALPHVDISKPQAVVGTNTVACMQSGVFWGYIGLVREICARIKAERDRKMRVIATGGLAPLFQQAEVLFDDYQDDLTMHGLTVIHKYNKDLADNMSSERLIYLPLGGAGEIGMNAYVYGYGKPDQERLIVVDLGVAFPDMDTTPGVDLIIADIDWLVQRKDRIEAVFVTHAHEDHVGGVAHTYDRLQAPIYARRFTANIAKRKMDEYAHPDDAVQVVGPWPHQVNAGPFKVGFQPISHSIPESSALVIDTPAGRIVHSGDFKVDLTPGVGEPFDASAFEEIAKDGVKALICDSTNVFSPDAGRSEATLGPALEELVSGASGMIVATTFASNVARVKTLAVAGEKAGRSIVLLGRAMKRMVEASVETGVLDDFPNVISPEQARDVPRENLMLLVTGSQGERRAASAQLARGKYMGIELKEGDTFLFSSKTIPGNEKGVIGIINQLSQKGVDVVDDSSGRYHVSGHANRPDLETLHDIVKPQVLIPMHGEHRHLREHVKIAEGKGITGVLAVNGMMIDLSGNAPKVAEYVETGRTYLDGSVQVGAMDGVIRDRIRMALNGHMTVTVLLDEDDEPLGDPWVDAMGLPETGSSKAALTDVVEHDLSQWLGRQKARTLRDDDALNDGLKKAARQSAFGEIGKKPEVTVVVSRLS